MSQISSELICVINTDWSRCIECQTWYFRIVVDLWGFISVDLKCKKISYYKDIGTFVLKQHSKSTDST